MDKATLRKQIRTLQKQQDAELLKTWSQSLFERIEQQEEFLKAQTVFLYYSMPGEVDTHAFIDKWYGKKNIVLPVVCGDDLELRVYKGKEQMAISSYGILEPQGEPFTAYDQIDFAVIPGLAFDREGNRLGRGKGYYDRTLPLLNCYKIGVCFQFQLVDSVPTEPFDFVLNAVCTEQGRYSNKA